MSEGATTHGKPTGMPLQLIRQDPDTKQFVLEEEAVSVLERIREPLAVIAVVGRARTGKSYILNQLLGDAHAGFEVASSYRPCTKGLWMWSEPIRRTALDGSTYYLVLLDTEGIDAYNQTAHDGVALFSLALLLSSSFVYNQVGGIDEAALDSLGLVTQLTQRIRVRGGGGGGAGLVEDPSALASFTPSLTWLLRDFYFELEDEQGAKQSPRDYLETALMPTPGKGPGVDDKNMIRSSIRALFPDRDCATLVRPCAEEADLRRLGRGAPRGALRPEFVQGVERLSASLLSRAQPKRLGSQLLSGPLLAGLAAAYVGAINGGAVPTILTAWQSVAEAECQAAVLAAEDAYRAAFNEEGTPADEAALAEEHQRALDAASAAFAARAVGEAGLRARYAARYAGSCALAFAAARERVLSSAAAELERRLGQEAARLHAELRRPDAAFDALAASLAAGLGEVVAGSAGQRRWPVLLDFCHRQYAAIGGELLERQARAAAAEAGHRAEEAARLEGEVERLREEAKRLQALAFSGGGRALEVGKPAGQHGGGGGGARGGRGAGGADREPSDDGQPRGCLGCFAS